VADDAATCESDVADEFLTEEDAGMLDIVSVFLLATAAVDPPAVRIAVISSSCKHGF
jgi:hypothetical protein